MMMLLNGARKSKLEYSKVFQSSKDDSILVVQCPHYNHELFPLDKLVHPVGNYYMSPHESIWKSCEDAYSTTWRVDENNDIIGLPKPLKSKLMLTMGFCPHLRCQLTNVSNSVIDGKCPLNLCYTKLENGSATFGACCFVDGVFNNGALIGYFNKTQSTAKPIYKKSRIILGDKVGGTDESYESFVNANLIYPGIIATQCPMSTTILDLKQMILEQNISLWIQLAPYSISGDAKSENLLHPHCVVLPEALLHFSQIPLTVTTTSLNPLDVGISSNNNSTSVQALRIMKPSDGYCSTTTTNNTCDYFESKTMIHIWYHNWNDFGVPPEEDFEVIVIFIRTSTSYIRFEKVIRSIIKRAAGVVKDGGTVAISCLSGRGRTGTLAAAIIG